MNKPPQPNTPQAQNPPSSTPSRAEALRRAVEALSGLPVLEDESLQRQQDAFDRDQARRNA